MPFFYQALDSLTLFCSSILDPSINLLPADDEDYLTPWEWLLREYDLTQQELLAGELRGAGLENGANVGFDPMLMPFGKPLHPYLSAIFF